MEQPAGPAGPSPGSYPRQLRRQAGLDIFRGLTIALSVVSGERTDVYFSVPTHVAQRNGIEPGARASVSLLAEGIHLMPAAGNPGGSGDG